MTRALGRCRPPQLAPGAAAGGESPLCLHTSAHMGEHLTVRRTSSPPHLPQARHGATCSPCRCEVAQAWVQARTNATPKAGAHRLTATSARPAARSKSSELIEPALSHRRSRGQRATAAARIRPLAPVPAPLPPRPGRSALRPPRMSAPADCSPQSTSTEALARHQRCSAGAAPRTRSPR